MIRKMRTTIARPADITQYAAGDEISNSATAGSVVRMTFDLTGHTKGRILSAAIDVTPASGNLVITALDLDMYIFKTPDAPAAVGDNVTNPLTGLQQANSIGYWRFDDAGWVNQLGALTAGTSGFQKVAAQVTVPLATPSLQVQHVPGHLFDFTGQTLAQRELTVVLRALAAWNPTAVINTFGLTLEFDVD